MMTKKSEKDQFEESFNNSPDIIFEVKIWVRPVTRAKMEEYTCNLRKFYNAQGYKKFTFKAYVAKVWGNGIVLQEKVIFKYQIRR